MPESLLPWITGPVAALVILAIAAWLQKKELDQLHDDIRTGKLVPRERLDEKESDRAEISRLLDKALDTSDTATRVVERTGPSHDRSSRLSASAADAERRIRGR